ncbi:hypothetical protein LR48_Vigan01g192100 [Vigna angularis]|uniref:PGG domain-containing protein n=2 Tax=Phaseolus angularis TaxID=3914 RepID=A0A0L9TP82_PHAAN|nr:hypothetical protein LR48_Vigan01g192100 [Vigna angularis]
MVVNSVNERGMTPLDVLTVFQSEAGDLEIYRSLVKAGAKSGKDIENENEAGRIRQPFEVEIVHETHVPPRNCTDEESNLPKTTEEFEELFAYKPNRDSTNHVRTILVTVAALMITATYQAVLSPPGGVWQEDTHQYGAGKSILATKSKNNIFVVYSGQQHWILYLFLYDHLANVWLSWGISFVCVVILHVIQLQWIHA